MAVQCYIIPWKPLFNNGSFVDNVIGNGYSLSLIFHDVKVVKVRCYIT